MRSYKLFYIIILFFGFNACSRTPPASTPLETLKAYTTAIKKKDTTTMKLLLSDASIKMHEQEAKAQNVTLDDIVERETLFNADQTQLKFKDVKIEGDKATIAVENAFGGYDIVSFIKEDNVWKIDKQNFADQILQQVNEKSRELDELGNQSRQP